MVLSSSFVLGYVKIMFKELIFEYNLPHVSGEFCSVDMLNMTQSTKVCYKIPARFIYGYNY